MKQLVLPLIRLASRMRSRRAVTKDVVQPRGELTITNVIEPWGSARIDGWSIVIPGDSPKGGEVQP